MSPIATTRKVSRLRPRGYRIYICGGDMTPVLDTTSDCPERAGHTPAPRGYGDWEQWARDMARTHRQQRCAGCNLWKVWVSRWPTRARRRRQLRPGLQVAIERTRAKVERMARQDSDAEWSLFLMDVERLIEAAEVADRAECVCWGRVRVLEERERALRQSLDLMVTAADFVVEYLDMTLGNKPVVVALRHNIEAARALLADDGATTQPDAEGRAAAQDVAWLIEVGQPEGFETQWWTGQRWTRDATEAQRFTSRVGAEAAISRMEINFHVRLTFGRAVEHGFVDDARLAARQPGDGE